MLAWVCLTLSALGLTQSVFAETETFRPTDDATIVETLRERPLDRTDLEFRQMRQALRRNPTSLPVALRVAQRAIEIARRDSDPRYLGYAEAALTPFGSGSARPKSVRLFDAIILQSNHHFDESLAVLGEILAADPGDAQAWLTQASILQVQARYAEARASCAHLGPLGARAYEIACEAEIDSLTGQARPALERINGLIAELEPAGATTALSGASAGASAGAPIPAWLVIIRAEMAERVGQLDLAERDYQAAVLAHSDAYAKAAYADFLLDRDRPLEVITLLQGEQRADPLLLRLALAYQAAHRTELAGSIEALKARFAAAHLRGDTVHLREEARFTLHLENDPVAALRLAELDWAVQKEPADARGLLEAARLTNDRAAIETVRSTLGAMEDQRLAPLLR